MPKLKSKGAIKKRFKVTKSGKVMASRPGRGHMHASKNGKQSRKLREQLVFEGTWGRLIRKMIKG